MTKAPNTPRRERPDIEEHPVKGGAVIYIGALVCLGGGWAVPGRSAPGLVTVGVAERGASPAIDGGDTVRTRRGVFQFANSAGADRIDRSAIGRPAYVVDDQTVALTDAAGTRSLAGQVRDVEALGVWVEI